ncbi:methyltransferase type 11 [Pectobacterium brasiliense]|uniref:O-linked N-acetylglucosamine transferase family protein n=1 Tax=Pectobacterium brasiliense TaxID=180957 RepID=UPI0004E6C685|nr:methyltransferase regulatory domain-containing protein [Pectobacterium brasiliense]KFF72880.1 methyltransferase type 11 [Pectobacterium brasiliense]
MILDTAASNPTTNAADRCPLSYTSPTHLQAVAYLHGVVAADPDRARVLELGCMSGANLLPFATAYPQAQAIGIDLDEEKITQGQIWVQEYGLTNLQLQAMDLVSLLDSDLGKFDYIIVHGVFGLLSGEARSTLLAYCRRHLSAKGVVCFSYATYPGGKTEEILQDALNLHASLAETPEQQQASARAMLSYLSLGMSADNPQRTAIATSVKEAEKLGDVSLALNYLQGLNQPCYLIDFNTQITQEGLAYVGEIEPHSEIPAHFGPQVDKLHLTVCPDGNKILKQQYLDFAIGRKRRFSMLVAEDRAHQITPEIDVSRLDKLSWAGSYRRVMMVKTLASNAHVANDGIQIFTDHELTQRILDVLGEAWPASVNFKQLVFNTRFPENEDVKHEGNVREALYALLKQGLSGLHFCLGECAYRKSNFSALRVLPNVGGVYPVFNYWYESFVLTSSIYDSQILLDQLVTIDSERLTSLDDLHFKGLLIGSAIAWQKYFQKRLMRAISINEITQFIAPLIMYSSDASGGGFFKSSDAKKVEKGGRKFINTPINVKIKIQLDELIKQQKYAEARQMAEELTITQPDNLQSWITLERINHITGDKNAAIFSLVKVISLFSNAWLIYSELASLFHSTSYYWNAINLAYKVIRCDSHIAQAWNVAALVYLNMENVSGAEVCLQKALQLLPNDSAIMNSMAMVLDKQSRVDESVSYYRRAVELAPNDLGMFSNLLFALSHDANVSAAELFAEHRRFGEIAERSVDGLTQTLVTYSQNKKADRLLRIGFVSGDLWSHPVSNFIEPAWHDIDRSRFSLYAYSTSHYNDDTSSRLRKGTNSWHNVANMSDNELFELIQKDKIDILIDLSGHTAYNRLTVFARKPAPVQITWIGYPGTTGLKAMDYRLIGYYQAKPGELDSQGTEKLVYLSAPKTKTFEPIAGSPGVNRLPALTNKYITFGSLNRPSKLNDVVLETWSKILVALPESKMLFGAMPSEDYKNMLSKKLQDYGVREEQLIFHRRMDMISYLKLHHEVDLMLDSFPYTGGTTAVHAAWMGIPTLTLAGETPASRQGVSIARTCGLDEFVASSIEDFISRAIYWNHHIDELAVIRTSLRSRMEYQEGEKVSAADFLELALRKTWEIYCSDREAKSFSVLPDKTIIEHQ